MQKIDYAAMTLPELAKETQRCQRQAEAARELLQKKTRMGKRA
jgi:hypothetical protein